MHPAVRPNFFPSRRVLLAQEQHPPQRPSSDCNRAPQRQIFWQTWYIANAYFCFRFVSLDGISCHVDEPRLGVLLKKLRIGLLAVIVLLAGCPRLQQPFTKNDKPKPGATQQSTIKVVVSNGGPVVLNTGTTEFQVRPDGYIQAFLLK